eukprot:scpid12664/ scgid25540/ 
MVVVCVEPSNAQKGVYSRVPCTSKNLQCSSHEVKFVLRCLAVLSIPGSPTHTVHAPYPLPAIQCSPAIIGRLIRLSEVIDMHASHRVRGDCMLAVPYPALLACHCRPHQMHAQIQKKQNMCPDAMHALLADPSVSSSTDG